MRLDPTLASSVVLADLWLKLQPWCLGVCMLFARGRARLTSALSTIAHAQYTIKHKGSRTIQRHNRLSRKYLLYIEWSLFVWSEIQWRSWYDFSSCRWPLTTLLRSCRPLSRPSVAHPRPGQVQVPFLPHRVLYTQCMLPQHGIMIGRQISCTIQYTRLKYYPSISVTSVTHSINIILSHTIHYCDCCGYSGLPIINIIVTTLDGK